MNGPIYSRLKNWHKFVSDEMKIVIYFPIFSWNTSTHLGHEVIKPKCLNTSKNFWASSVSGPVEVTNSCVQSL